jgi:hypothetical protein
VSTRTDWAPEPRLFRRAGTYVRPEPSLWKDNGFASAARMLAMHQPILRALAKTVPARGKIVDLGCGNGLLLQRLRTVRPDVAIAGVEEDADAVSRARMSLRGEWLLDQVEQGTWTALRDVTSIALSPIRVLDMTDGDADVCRRRLAAYPQVFVYAYDDCLRDHGSLAALCEKTRLGSVNLLFASDTVQIGVLRRA